MRWRPSKRALAVGSRQMAGALFLIAAVALAIGFAWPAGAPASANVTLPKLGQQLRPTFSAGANHSLVISANGFLWAWGENQFGQLGDETNTKRATAVPIGTSNAWVAVSAGGNHSLALRSDGSLWAWGSNDQGQLGLGQIGGVRYAPERVGSGMEWVGVFAGGSHSLALRSDGTLWAWGGNQFGQLGDGTTTDRASLRQVGSGNWAAVSAGHGHSLALKSDGSLWAWGWNALGQLGDGTYDNRLDPNRIGSDTDWVAVSAGGSHSLALKSDGSLWGWGYNEYGQVGDNTTSNRNVPTRVGASTDWAAVSAGAYHSLGVKTNGLLLAWGCNDSGQLGNGDTAALVNPHFVGLSGPFGQLYGGDWVAVSAGGSHSLGLDDDGALWAWGSNQYGQVGNNGTANALEPDEVFDPVKMPTPVSTSTSSSSSSTSSTSSTTLLQNTTFTDVSGSPYETAIYALAAESIVTGFQDNTFRPNDIVKRQQFAKMIVKTMGYAVTGSEVCPYTDVAAQIGSDPLYPSKYVAVCASAGVTKGTSATTFNPTGDITRQQLISMVVRAAALADPQVQYTPPFSAAQFSLNEHYHNARRAAAAGLLDGLIGIGPAYSFLAPASRGECAQILYNLKQK